MLTAVAFVPGAPLVVPALSGPGAVDAVELRTATLEVAARLARSAQRWIAVGVGEPGSSGVLRGSFAGFGVDEQVSLRPELPGHPDATVSASDPMSTPMLIAGWIRGQVAPGATIFPTLISATATQRECAQVGTALGARIADTDSAVGVLVVADGSFGLTAGAPGGAIEGAGEFQDAVDAAVATGDLGALEGLGSQRCAELGIAGRPAWQVAAAIWRAAGDAQVPVAGSTYCAAPFGVGYQVAWWSS